MLPIVKIPELVKHYTASFKSDFSPASFEYFQKYLSGIILSDNKTVESLNRLFVLQPRNQSNFNRFLNEHNYDLNQINETRITMLQTNERTQFKNNKNGGVLMFDDTLLEHYGRKMDYISYIWDHVNHSYVLAHNLVSFYYSDDQTAYPLDFKFKIPVDVEVLEKALKENKVNLNEEKQKNKKEKEKEWRQYLLRRWGDYQYKKPALQKAYQSKLNLALNMLTAFKEKNPELKMPVTFDSWFTKPDFCKYIDKQLKLAYVGALSTKERVILKEGKQVKLSEFIESLNKAHTLEENVFEKTPIKYKGRKLVYYCYCKVHRIKNFGKKLLMISYDNEDRTGKARCFICNRHHWHASRIARISRHRWPIEEYHEEGKAQGLDQYQLRNFKAIQRHVAFINVVYSILELARNDDPFLRQLQDNFKEGLKETLAHWRRKICAQNLLSFVEFVILSLKNGLSLEEIFKPFEEAIAY